MSNFKILLSSDTEYNELCAEIFFNEEFVAIISQEEGFENLKIEIYPSADKCWSFNFFDFQNILNSAKEILWKRRKEVL